MNSIKFTINNKEIEGEVLYTFHSDNTNKDYLVCTDNTYTNDELNVYSFIYYPKNKEKGIEPIKKDEDWEEVQNFIDITEVDYND